MTDIKERGDQMEEACGVFGIYAQDESINVAEAAYYGLFVLQHRGQESAGIAVADGKGIKHYRNLGLVPEVFDEEILARADGAHLHRPRALFDLRQQGCNQRAAAGGAVQDRHAGAGTQRQSGQRGCAPGADGGRRRDFPDVGGYRGHTETDRAGKQQGADRGRPLHDGEGARQLRAGAAGQGQVHRHSRSVWHSPALPGAGRQQLCAGERELRARRGGRGVSPRRSAGRNRRDRRGRRSLYARQNADAQPPVPV